MELKFFVAGRKLTYKGSSAPIWDGVGCDTFSIDFDREWDGLTKLVELRNGSASAQVFYTGKSPLPRQVCGRGQLTVTCYGYEKQGDTAAVLVTRPMVRPIAMLGSAVPGGSTDQPDTPSAFEQMAAQIRQAAEVADEAKRIAEDLLRMKEKGAFNGLPGQAATISVDDPVAGDTLKVENRGTERHAVLRFTIPTKLSLGEKEQLRKELLGDVERSLDAILTLQAQYMGGAEA